MKSWEIAANPHPNWRRGSVSLTDEPWWLYVVGWCLDNPISWLCCNEQNPIANISLPNMFPKYRNDDPVRDLKALGFLPQDTLRDWYGTVGDMWHVFIFGPVYQWYWQYRNKYVTTIEIGYDKLKELFGKTYPDFFKSLEKYRL